jgi:hypothetical protein
MGPTRNVPTQIAYRERDTKPFGGVEKGIEILKTGTIFWGKTYAEAIKKAEEVGYII